MVKGKSLYPCYIFLLKIGRGDTLITLENLREKGEIFKANRVCGVRDALAPRQKFAGDTDAHTVDVRDDALARVLLEEVAQGVLALVERGGNAIESEWLRVVLTDIFERFADGFVFSHWCIGVLLDVGRDGKTQVNQGRNGARSFVGRLPLREMTNFAKGTRDILADDTVRETR